MEKKKFITEHEQTRITKSFHGGWSGETLVKIKGYCYQISTNKNSRGEIHSEAMKVTDRGSDKNFRCIEIDILSAKRYDLGRIKGLATEKNIREQHLKALCTFDEIQDQLPELKEAYKIEPGQVVFLNGYGQDEYDHENQFIYKIDEDNYYSVNEKNLQLSQEKLSRLKDIKDKFGIGIYYKQNDKAEMDYINNLVIDAHEKIKRDEAERPAREAEAKALLAFQTDEMIAAYPFLLKDDKQNGGVFVAKNIRIELKRNFPDIVFKVTSDYSSVNIGWTNGPTEKQVKAITRKYSDHVTDFTGDFRDYEPSLFNEIFGGCNYVFENRHVTDEVFAIFYEWSARLNSDMDDHEKDRQARLQYYDTEIPDYFPFVLKYNAETYNWFAAPVDSIQDEEKPDDFTEIEEYHDPNQLSLF
jgi:hypothetical protein